MGQGLGNEHSRVVIIEKGDRVSLEVNFAMRAAIIGDEDADIAELANEWTSQTIMKLNVTPSLADLGGAIGSYTITNEVIDFLKENSQTYEESVEDGGKRYSFIVHDDDLGLISKRIAKNTSIFKASKSLRRAALSSVIAEFDYFMSRFLHIIAKREQIKFLSFDESFTLKQISEYKTLDELKEHKVFRKIESLLHGSHTDLLDWICNNLKLTSFASVKSSEYFKYFVEAGQRRHLIMHNGGMVNERYLQCCKAAGWKDSELKDIGEELEVNVAYLRKAAANCYMVGFSLLHLYWQKNYKNGYQNSFSYMLSSSHDFLDEGLTKMATRVIDFAEASKSEMSFRLQMSFGINRALSALHDPSLSIEEQNKKARDILGEYDWSATDPVYDLALACVRREFENVIQLAKSANVTGKVNHHEAATWVLFKEAREHDGFMECFPKAALQIEMAK